MRIIAGKLGGRQFESPHGHRTHPMSEKGRGALFNVLGDIEGLTVLDAFTGSGALGLEALSRGAKHVTAIDIDRSAISTVVKNADSLGLSSAVKAVRAGAGSWLETQPDAQYDLVLLDPPYDDVQPGLLARLAGRARPGGTVVLSLPPQAGVELGEDFELLRGKNYSDAELVFYRRNS